MNETVALPKKTQSFIWTFVSLRWRTKWCQLVFSISEPWFQHRLDCCHVCVVYRKVLDCSGNIWVLYRWSGQTGWSYRPLLLPPPLLNDNNQNTQKLLWLKVNFKGPAWTNGSVQLKSCMWSAEAESCWWSLSTAQVKYLQHTQVGLETNWGWIILKTGQWQQHC